MLELFWLITGIALGGACGWLISKYKFKSESKSNDTALKVFEERIRDLAHELESAKTELKRERDKVITLSNRLSGSEAEYRHLESKLLEQKDEINKLHEKFVFEFKQLAQDILEEKSKKFTEQNQTNLEILLKPLGEKLVNFEKSIVESNRDRILHALRYFACGLQDERVRTGRHRLKQAIGPIIDTSVEADFGEIATDQREIVFLIGPSDTAYTVQGVFIANMATKGIARVCGIGNQPPLFNRSNHGLDRTRLWVRWMNFYESRHARIVGCHRRDARSFWP